MQRRNTITFALAVAGVCSTCLGCGYSGPKLVKVNGRILLKGQPLACGVVTFQPLENGQVATRRPSIGVIGADGHYRVSTFAPFDGAMPGDYLVSVDGSLQNGDGRPAPIDAVDAPPQINPVAAVPQKYLSPQTSGLKATVPADVGETTIDFALLP